MLLLTLYGNPLYEVVTFADGLLTLRHLVTGVVCQKDKATAKQQGYHPVQQDVWLRDHQPMTEYDTHMFKVYNGRFHPEVVT